MPHSFAYLFERFPSFLQTFVYREAAEMVRQGMAPWLVSIRQPDDPDEPSEPIDLEVSYLPPTAALRTEIDALGADRQLPAKVRKAIAEWRQKTDSNRVFEAAWLGPRLRERGIRHVHAHFGGLAARTAWMLKELFGFTYSFTGHANDIFCENEFPVTNEMLVRGARLVVTETDFARRWMAEKYSFARGKIVRVFNGIETNGFLPREPAEAAAPGTEAAAHGTSGGRLLGEPSGGRVLGEKGAVPRIISIGRYVEKKGFADLIEACRLLRARGRRFECSIIGGGPLEANLRTRIERANLVGFVYLLGPRSQIEVRQLLVASQVFALACVPEGGGGSDNLPTVIMEAMLAGLPVVSTRIAGVPEMVDEGETGLLVAPKDLQGLAAAMEKLLADPALATRLGARGRELAIAKFSIEKTTRELKHLLVRRCGVQPPAAVQALDPAPMSGSWRRFLKAIFTGRANASK